MRRRPALTALLLLLCGAGAGGLVLLTQRGAAGGESGAEAPRASGRGSRGGGPVPVTAAAVRQDVPILLDAIGTVQAFNTITVRAQVDGQLVEIAFREGQDVKRGDLLARIDSRSYQAALDQALAKKAQDEALLANARLDLQRYTTLARAEGVSRQQQDTQRAQVAQYEAQVAADQAAIDSARTQLSFTTIFSPIDGRVGLRLVDQGNLARAGDATGIVSVAQLRPIAVIFTLPQQELPRVLDALNRGPVPVEALAQASGAVAARGELLTLDNQVDPQTQRDRGLGPRAAIVEASMLRFRPIMMTTLAALLGALPLVLERGTGSELRLPLGVSVVGGLLLSQVVTLYTTPVVYLAMERGRELAARLGRRGRRRLAAAAASRPAE